MDLAIQDKETHYMSIVWLLFRESAQLPDLAKQTMKRVQEWFYPELTVT